MRKTVFALSLLLAVVSCTKKLEIPEDPEIGIQGRTMVTVTVADYDGVAFEWGSDVRIGIYDSNGHTNERYTLLSDYVGQTGPVEMYGGGIDGALMAYLPYTPKGYPCVGEGRQPVLPVQVYAGSAIEHFRRNAVLVAASDDNGRIPFSYDGGQTGLLHLTLNFSVTGNVQEVMLHCPGSPLAGSVAIRPEVDPLVVDGSSTVTVTSVNKPCSETAPLEVWAIVPAGEYSHLTVSVKTAGGVQSSPVDGTFIVIGGGRQNIETDGKDPSGGNEEFTVIDGEYK